MLDKLPKLTISTRPKRKKKLNKQRKKKQKTKTKQKKKIKTGRLIHEIAGIAKSKICYLK